MTTLQERVALHVIGGVDTHKNTHHAAVIDSAGRLLGDQQFPATGAGHRRLLAWLRSFGELESVGVEGTGSYGAALTRLLQSAGVRVVEVNRPSRAARRRDGKSDRLDAEQAARAVLAGTATAAPKSRTGAVEAIRLLRVTRSTAVKARTQATNALHAAVLAAPDELREHLQGVKGRALVTRCARLRAETGDLASLTDQPERLHLAAAKTALRELATRWLALDAEARGLKKQLTALVSLYAPQLIALQGVGSETAAQLLITAGDNADRITGEAAFAKLCGVCPQPASSGRTTGRHRLSRGGDRDANSALYMITVTRLRRHDPTRRYVARRTAEGLSKREIMRCLKRYIAREIFAALPPPATSSTTTTMTAIAA
ncbi:IS110 family RNA-guided transposase [Jatrophihabitans fulvus]